MGILVNLLSGKSEVMLATDLQDELLAVGASLQLSRIFLSAHDRS